MEQDLRQKQIEEMHKEIDELWIDYPPTTSEVVEAILNLGYRKIPENAVVVSKQVWDEHIENWDKTTKAVEEQARKETAELFAERLNEQFADSSRLCEQIDEIAKEIGGE